MKPVNKNHYEREVFIASFLALNKNQQDILLKKVKQKFFWQDVLSVFGHDFDTSSIYHELTSDAITMQNESSLTP